MGIGRRAVVFALLAGLAAPISAKTDEIDQYITAQMQRLHIPGVSLAIVRDGKIIKAQGYGVANPELSTHATKKRFMKSARIPNSSPPPQS